MKKTNAKLIVLIGVIFVSFSAILIKLSTAPSFVIAFYRLLFSVLIMLPLISRKHYKELITIDKKALLLSLLSGIFLALHFATWIESLRYTSIASSTLLVCTSPVFTLLGGYIFLSEKVSYKSILSVVGTLLGSFIISYGDFELGGMALYGDLLAILGAFFVAIYMLIGRAVRQKISVIPYTFIVYSSASVVLLILSLINRVDFYPYPSFDWLIFVGLAIFSTLLGHSIFNWALKYVKTTYISTAVLAEPVLTILWAMLIFTETPNLWQLFGSIIILVSIYFYVKNE